MNKLALVLAMILAGALFSGACEDDPRDLDYLKKGADAGKDAGQDAGKTAAQTAAKDAGATTSTSTTTTTSTTKADAAAADSGH